MKPGDFLAVVGQVGSGKTSLLQSIMQETNLVSGKC
jgi:ABC-type lipoprotein export system ATPase subunit